MSKIRLFPPCVLALLHECTRAFQQIVCYGAVRSAILATARLLVVISPQAINNDDYDDDDEDDDNNNNNNSNNNNNGVPYRRAFVYALILRCKVTFLEAYSECWYLSLGPLLPLIIWNLTA